jgi:hypothetical protein
MDEILTAIALVVILLALGMAAIRWGADSRPGFSDNHNR